MRAGKDWFLLAASALLLGVAILVAAQSSTWVGRTFPGFLVLENRVIASAGLAHWPATAGGSIYQYEVLSVDGAPTTTANALHQYVESKPPGTSIEYELTKGSEVISRSVASRTFGSLDYSLLFGALFINGVAFGLIALMIRFLRGRDTTAAGGFATLFVSALWSITAVDLYGPYDLFRMHAACETFLFAGVLHWTLVFPQPSQFLRKRPKTIHYLYAAATALAITNQIWLYDPAIYRITHHIAVVAFGGSLIFMIGGLLYHFLRPPSFEAKQKIKVVALGGGTALFGPLLIAWGAAVTGGEVPQNLMAVTGILFPISVAYAILRHNLLDVDVFVRRTLNYGVLSVIATAVYFALIQVADYFVGAPSAGESDPVRIVLPLALVLTLLPLRDMIQSGVDRTFFRSSYDFRRTIETASARLASFVELQPILGELSHAIGTTLHPDGLSLYVNSHDKSGYERLASEEAGPVLEQATFESLARDKHIVELPNGSLAVPCLIGGDLVAVMSLSRLSSGRMYGGDDRRLLMTLANQGAVAIENALALERVKELNRDLEAKVIERTEELRQAHTQLVHREKMASLGQFVAGIAHELNNPLNFVQGNLFCLREYVETIRVTLEEYDASIRASAPDAAATIDAIRKNNDLEGILEDIEAAFAGCAEGVERSTTLVADLGKFSRRDDAEMAPADIASLLESSLNLLRGKLNGITVTREFTDVEPVMCLTGQLDQVFVNLIANACDATGDGGNIKIATSQPADRSVVAITIQDDGPGILEEHIQKIFDPFFTTKEVGKGTGLGLSISYGIVERHNGRISVESKIGSGTTFRIELPVTDGPPNDERTVQ